MKPITKRQRKLRFNRYIKNLENLDANEFYYGTWHKKPVLSGYKKPCGFLGCAGGYTPFWFGSISPVSYKKWGLGVKNNAEFATFDILSALSSFLGVNYQIGQHLFLPGKQLFGKKHLDVYSTPKEVARLFRVTLEYLEKNNIEPV